MAKFLRPKAREEVEYAVQAFKEGKTIEQIADDIAEFQNKPGFDVGHLQVLMALWEVEDGE